MPRVSAKQVLLRHTKTRLVKAFFLRQSSRLDRSPSTSSSSSSSDSSDRWTDSSDSSSSSSSSSSDSSSDLDSDLSSSDEDSDDSMRTGSEADTSDEEAQDLEQLQDFFGGLESRRVILARRMPRETEPLISVLQRLRQLDSPSDLMFFRHLVRMTPDAFDTIVQLVSVHPVFQDKNPERLGAPVDEQVAVALYRFGRYGNGGGVLDVAYTCGCGEGSVVAYSWRVAAALYGLREQVLCWASEEEKQEARLWVATHSQCVEFSRRWSMVDGSLIPMAFKPGKKAYHREYSDRKGQ
ncbi:hypothetical protein CF326_g9046 [Tilletia indica]|nr:hypothetical protein CF326_g9046 [Tilletia indica]